MFVQHVAKAEPKEVVTSRRNRVPLRARRIAPGNQATLQWSATLQPKLAIGRVDDPLECEADRVADQVVAGLEPSSVPEASATPMRLSWKCADCDEKDEQLQPRSEGTARRSEAPAAVHNVFRSGGLPLDPGTRAFMEPRFGHRFDEVRIHTDAKAASSAKDVHANAYTLGKHIVFAGGQYAPGTVQGRKLLAHELTHVLQQSGTLHRDVDVGAGGQEPRDAGTPGEEGQNRDEEIEWMSQMPQDAGSGAAQNLNPAAGAVPTTTPTVMPEITLETGNNSGSPLNDAVHQNICVTGGGPRKECFSFAAAGVQAPQFSSTWLGWSSMVIGALIEGTVYHPAPVSGAAIVSRHTPTAAQAARWLAYMRGTRWRLHDGYSVARHNCRLFSQLEFRDAPSHW